ncbi:protein MAATS1 [Kipferlia bialata]|uniref:Protein MAATS1 n=1 Tax=Kipferlia bialata TaxID=797122 RepID=A0A9K3CN93_9EUKA|nr:protein MAATS1 [Kipferlia bialata]|eukprot:g1000.t1
MAEHKQLLAAAVALRTGRKERERESSLGVVPVTTETVPKKEAGREREMSAASSVTTAAPAPRAVTEEETETPEQRAESLSLFDAVVFLQRLLRGRAQQNYMFLEKEKRLGLVHEIRLAEEIQRARAAPVLLDAAAQARIDEIRSAFVTSSTTTAVGSAVSQAISALHGDRVRRRDLARLGAIMRLAEAQRGPREDAEKERRQSENISRMKRDFAEQKGTEAYAGSSHTLVTELMSATVSKVARRKALVSARRAASAVAALDDAQYETERQDPAAAMHGLMNSMLMPEVDRQTARYKLKQEQAKYLHAARHSLTRALNQIEAASEVDQ